MDKRQSITCKSCPFRGRRSADFYPLLTGSHDVMVIGTQATKKELADRKYFTGATGNFMEQVLSRVGYDTSKVYYTKAVKCLVPKEPKPSAPMLRKAINNCRVELFDEIRRVNPKIILAFGGLSVKVLFGEKETLKSYRGLATKSDLLGENSPYIITMSNPAVLMDAPGKYKEFIRILRYSYEVYSGKPVRATEDTVYHVMRNIVDVNVFKATLKKFAGDSIVPVGVDIETTGLDKRTEEYLTFGISYKKGESYVLARSALHLTNELTDIPYVAYVWHNFKFDVPFLQYKGYTARGDEDIMLGSYTLNEESGIHSLGVMSTVRLGAKEYKKEADVHIRNGGLDKVDEEVMYKRVAIDADYTLQLHHIIRPKISSNPMLENVYSEILLPGARFLGRVEDNGMPMDRRELEVMAENLQAQIDELEDEIYRITSPYWDVDEYMLDTKAKSANGTLRHPDGMNPGSTYQLAWLLYDKFKLKSSMRGGGRSTDDAHLKSLNKTPKFVPMILELRSLQKELSTYVKGFLNGLDENDRVHTSFTQHVASTGRLSSTKPNIQNIKKVMKKAVRAGKGRVIIEADYKAAELRLVAEITGCKFLKEVFIKNLDMHDEMASRIFGPHFTDMDRRKAKEVNFGIVYGLTADSIVEKYGVTVQEAKQIIEDWFREAPEVLEYIQSCKNAVRKGKALISLYGRHRRPGLVTKRNLVGLENEFRNFPIQSPCTDMDLISAIRLEKPLEELGAKIIDLVHDSIIVDAPNDPEIIKKIAYLMNKVMTTVPVETFNATVPFEVDVSVGLTWYEQVGIMSLGKWGKQVRDEDGEKHWIESEDMIYPDEIKEE